MNKEEFLSYPAETQARLRESFDFLTDIGVSEMGGDNYLTKDGVPLNALTKMSESDFVKDWLVMFALNNTASNQNYFNFIKWGELSNQHTMCVMIMSDENPKEVLFVVKPLSSYEMSNEERELMHQSQAALISSLQSKVDGLPGGPDPSHIISKTESLMDNKGNTPIHDLIPKDFYVKHGLYVTALRNAVWLKDNYFNGNATSEVLQKAREIFEKEERDGCASLEEYQWLNQACHLFEIPHDLLAHYGVNGAKSTIENNKDDNNTTIDLLSC